MDSAVDRFFENPAMQEALRRVHESDLAHAAYREGFYSESDENPYEFDTKTNLERIKIASKKGELTSEEKARLEQLSREMNAKPWSLWSSGHHRRQYSFLKG